VTFGKVIDEMVKYYLANHFESKSDGVFRAENYNLSKYWNYSSSEYPIILNAIAKLAVPFSFIESSINFQFRDQEI